MIPYATFADPRAAMATYEKALNAETVYVMDGPGGMVMHAEMNIGGQRFMLSGEWPGMSSAPEGRSPVNFMLYVDDVDSAYRHALDNGMTSAAEPENMFWGDRMARLNDGHGYEWSLAQQVEELSEDEINERAKQYAESMAGEGHA